MELKMVNYLHFYKKKILKDNSKEISDLKINI